MDTPPLDSNTLRVALDHLGVTASAADRGTLAALLDAYVRRVPWESASRIAKRAVTGETRDCPRWPDEFWLDAATKGTGGTCFESNYAFFSLLRSLGFDGYLTINDMKTTTGCHTAIVVRIGSERLLVDAGFPVHCLIAIDEQRATSATSPYESYVLQPEGNQRYTLTRRLHPAAYCFTLIDRPIADHVYRAATTADYGDSGLFLDQVIVTRVVDGRVWRFADRDKPPCIASFEGGTRSDHLIDGEVAEAVSGRFGLDVGVLQRALATVADPPPAPPQHVGEGRPEHPRLSESPISYGVGEGVGTAMAPATTSPTAVAAAVGSGTPVIHATRR